MEKEKVKQADMIKEIGGVTYIVKAHFKEKDGETWEQKIMRLLRSEVTSMNFAK